MLGLPRATFADIAESKESFNLSALPQEEKQKILETVPPADNESSTKATETGDNYKEVICLSDAYVVFSLFLYMLQTIKIVLNNFISFISSHFSVPLVKIART